MEMPRLETVEIEGLKVSRVPARSFLKNRSCDAYLLESSGEMMLVDTGGDTDAAKVLELVSERGGRLSAVANTHVHFEQVAGDAPVADATGARIMVPESNIDLARRFGSASLEHRETIDLEELSLFFTHAEVSMFMNYFYGRHAGLGSPGTIIPLRDGEVLEFGGTRLEVVSAPGHSPGHICLLERDRGLLFSGDAACVEDWAYVERTPFEPGGPGDYVRFLGSLKKISSLPFEAMFSAEGFTLGGAIEHVEETLSRQAGLEGAVLEKLAGGPIGARDVAVSVHDEQGMRIDAYRMYLEVLTSLEHLESRGEVRRITGHPGEPRFEAARG